MRHMPNVIYIISYTLPCYILQCKAKRHTWQSNIVYHGNWPGVEIVKFWPRGDDVLKFGYRCFSE